MVTKNLQYGQVGIIAILIGVVIFTLGMATARRITTDIRTATLAEEGAKALAGAEAAMEIAFAKPKNELMANPTLQWQDNATNPSVIATYNATRVPATDETEYIIEGIPEGSVKTVWFVHFNNNPPDLFNSAPYIPSGPISIAWEHPTDSEAELIMYYTTAYNAGTPTSSPIKVKRWYVDDNGTNVSGIICNVSACSLTFNKTDLAGWSDATSRIFFLRIKPIKQPIGLVQIIFPDTPVPPQEFSIVVTAELVGKDIKRKVTARRLVGEIPVFFDYVLANSSGGIAK